jgi:hydroxypyruvate isomerase
MLRFSANLGFLWNDLPLLERVRRARAAGFDAVEFHYPYEVPAESLKRALDEAALPAVGINTRLGSAPGDFGLAALPGRENEARAAIDEAVAYAQAIGAQCVHVMAGKPGESDGERARDTFLSALDHASRRAGGAGTNIVIEPLNARDAPGYFLRTTKQAASIIAELNRSNVKLLFDCYHVQISEGDLTRRLEMLLPITGHIQVAAVPSRAEPDEGELAYERLFGAIDAMGYDGFIGAEYRPRRTVEEGLAWLRHSRTTA